MNRREFIKNTFAAVVGTSTLLTACRKSEKEEKSVEPRPNRELGEMTLRTNPNTGDKVSLLGFGMMRLPVVAGGTARENPDSPIDQEAVNQMVDYALAHGVNYFDTSPAYCQGMSEQSTGIALSRHPRNSYFISTKLSNFAPETWSLEESKAMFFRSLQYLKTEYLDYLLLHGAGMPGGDKDGMGAFLARYVENGLLDWLVGQKKKGTIRNLGFSYHGDIHVFDMLLRWHDEGKYHWDFVLIELNYLDWNYADEINPRNTDASYLYAELEKRGIPATIMEPLLGGRLAKQPASILREMKQMDINATPAEWAFRYAGTPKGVLTVLSGMTYMEHLQENCATYSPLRPITQEENTMLMRLADKLSAMKAVPCTACNYCMPCPYGLNIPVIFTYYNNCISEEMDKEQTGGDEESEFRKARRRKLIGYDRAVPRIRQADHCIGCNHCLSHCPQRIDIPKEMQRIDRFFEEIKRQG